MTMHIRNFAFVLLVSAAVLITGCTDTHPLEADRQGVSHELEGQYVDSVHDDALQVTGRTIQNITAELEDGNTFTGRIVNLAFEEITEDGVLATGRLVGDLNGERINQVFETVLPFVDEDGNVLDPNDVLNDNNGVTQILFLELGPVFLDLLGLVVEIPDPIIVEIRAEEGPGQLLGNLLVGLLGALD